MYAVIETGGKQYRVEIAPSSKSSCSTRTGKTIELGRVLLVAEGDDASIGRPVVDGAAVSAEVVRQGRGEKTPSPSSTVPRRVAESRRAIARS